MSLAGTHQAALVSDGTKSSPSVAIDLRLGDLPEAAKTSPVFHLHHYQSDAGFATELHIAD